MFTKAYKRKAKLRILLEGASGSGKTYSALLLASGISDKIAVIDTERGSASLYADQFNFDVCELSAPYEPERYIKYIKEAQNKGYEVLIIDSMSHEWIAEGGCLEIQSKLGGRYTDWGKVTPRHNRFIQAILNCNMHVICTARCKVDYAMEAGGNGYKVRKLAMSSELRSNTEYEFMATLRINQEHVWECYNDKTHVFVDKQGIITKEYGKELIDWLYKGEEDLPKNSDIKEKEQTLEKDKLKKSDEKMYELLKLIETERVPVDTVALWLDRAMVTSIEDLDDDKVKKLIDLLKNVNKGE